ncbi:Centromere protein 3 [Hypsizygus marmoreus]|uniref:CENP-C homolog n=1 Tax=Hypsizygus marmoreus TaxID=39966 RepID=A0A369JJ09_HYPMA|nr:Centromere protein 3 [Hypsizygus marmoreus]
MSTAARKSSVGAARRGLQKAHIPYRGDNPEVGKKTGIAVRHVERKSDGFEPFEEIMQQADKRTPPKPKGRKKKSMPVLEDEFDEDGEMSMELDDSPLQYFANSRQPVTPSNLSRNGSSSRPVARTSDVDFDQVPSPRPRGSIRKSVGHGPGPSSLSRSIHARDLEQESDPPENDYDDLENGGYNDQAGGSPNQDSPQGTSFTQMDQDDDDDEQDDPVGQQEYDEPEQEPTPPPARRDKGKGRATLSEVPEEPEDEVEDEIAKGLEDVQHQQYSDDDQADEEEHPEPEPRKVKKAKFAAEERHKPVGRPRGKSKKENRDYREGIRKSAREHYKPLEWWRGEKLVYGRSNNSGGGLVLVPPIREIVRIPKEIPEPLGKRKRGTGRGRSKSKPTDEVQIKIVPAENPEEGWDDETEPHCVVLEYPTLDQVQRRVAYTAAMLKPQKVATNDWSFQKVFGDADFIAAGVLVIPPKGRKPSKSTKDNTYVFYVIEGAVNLKIHETSLVLATGAMFIVPRGNTYFIENISDRDAKLFFTQARKVPQEEAEAAVAAVASSNRARSSRPSVDGRKSAPPQARSSSAAAMPADGGSKSLSKAAPAKRAASTRA